MQQLGLLPTATLTVNGGWPRRLSRKWLIAMRTCTVWYQSTDGNAGLNPLVKIADAAEDMLRLRRIWFDAGCPAVTASSRDASIAGRQRGSDPAGSLALPLDHAFRFELADVGPAAIEVQR